MFKFLRCKVVRLKTKEDIDKYSREFKQDMGYEVPSDFLQKGHLYAVVTPEKKYVGGYAFVDKHPLRSLQQIPTEDPSFYEKWNVGELTAVWLKDKTYGLVWSLMFVYHALRHPTKYWVYSYPISEVRLGKYYAMARPLYIYKGPIVRLEGHLENPEPESIEIITTWGVAKIALGRNIKYLKKLILG
jgi:hypothetical protein